MSELLSLPRCALLLVGVVLLCVSGRVAAIEGTVVPDPVPLPAAPPALITGAEPPPATPLSRGVAVQVRAIRVVGATAFSPEQLQVAVQPWLGRLLNSEDIEDVRQAVVRLYVDHGFVNSGALIPDQDVSAGVLVVRVIEGRLTQVQVHGNRFLRASRLEQRALRAAGVPLALPALRDWLQWLAVEPGVARVQAELRPGERPGEARLLLTVDEKPRYEVTYSVGNDRSPAFGTWNQQLEASARNWFGVGDEWQTGVTRAPGLQAGHLGLVWPVAATDMRLWARYEHQDAQVVEDGIGELDISSVSSVLQVGIEQPLLQTAPADLQVGLHWSRRTGRDTLGGIPFAFSVFSDEGRTGVDSWALALGGAVRTPTSGRTMHVELSRGHSRRVAAGFVPERDFVRLSLQSRWMWRGQSHQLFLLRAHLQWADTQLPGSERFGLGGVDSVRGYREALLTGDNGVLLGTELRYPLVQQSLPWLGRQAQDGWVQVVWFVDAGVADSHGARSQSLWSTGPGLVWEPAAGSRLALYWAAAREPAAGTRSNLQDQGVHLQLSVQAAF